jgi:hypothetical protein
MELIQERWISRIGKSRRFAGDGINPRKVDQEDWGIEKIWVERVQKGQENWVRDGIQTGDEQDPGMELIQERWIKRIGESRRFGWSVSRKVRKRVQLMGASAQRAPCCSLAP